MRKAKHRKRSLKEFCQLAVKWGARDAKVVSTKKVFTARWVRYKCQFGCGGFGKCLMCPPNSPTPEETRKLLDEYRRAVLVHCTENQPGLKELVVKLEREMFLDGYYKAFAAGAGPCRLCKECNMVKCKNPYKARPAMEAMGMDVYRTARSNGFRINVVRDHDDEQNYFGIVLAE